MGYLYNAKLTGRAKHLRKDMTEEERRLWYTFLRQFPIRFLRQKVLGNYIVDFYCAKARLVIELDGAQHYEGKAELQDQQRDAWLSAQDLLVLRFSNYDLNRKFKEICAYIEKTVEERV